MYKWKTVTNYNDQQHKDKWRVVCSKFEFSLRKLY
jgi:hypothetical protein